jgi:hypothetical protein
MDIPGSPHTTMKVERNVSDENGEHDFKLTVNYWDNTSYVHYSYETLWGQPELTQEYFNYLHDHDGYDSIRLPIYMNVHYLDMKNQIVDPLWMKRVREVINMVINAGMHCVLATLNEMKFLKRSEAFVSYYDSNYTREMDNGYRLRRMWEILANEFNDFSDEDLSFDLVNDFTIDDLLYSNDESKVQQSADITIQVYQYILDGVRSTGGNNATRIVFIGGINNDFELNKKYLAESFDEDFDENCIFAINYYEPWQFTVVAINTSWGTDEEISKMESDCASMKEAYKNGMPFVISEYSSMCNCYVKELQEKNLVDIMRWQYLACKNLSTIGCPMFFWDPGNEVNRKTLTHSVPFFLDMQHAAMKGEDFDIEAALEESGFTF